jgi:hypothetical protein
MKKWIGLVSLVVLSGCSNLGDGELTTQEFPLDDYHTVTTASNIDTYITASPTQQNNVSLTIDDNLKGKVKHLLDKGVLSISSEQNIEPTSATLEITSSSLNALNLEQHTKAWVAIHQFDDFSLNVIGNSDVMFSKVELEHFTINVSGVGNAQAMGMVKDLDILVSGKGDLDLSGLNSLNATVTITGDANIVLGTVNELAVVITGLGTVKYKTGSRALVQSKISGSGSVTAY